MIRPKCSLRNQPTRWKVFRLDRACCYLDSELSGSMRRPLAEEAS